MRGNEYNLSEVGTSGFGSGQPSNVIAPTFIQPTPQSAYTAPYAAPVVPAVGGAGFGGFGNGGILEGIILASLLGNRGLLGNGADGVVAGTVTAQNVADLRKDVADNAKEVHVLGNEIAAMFATHNLTNAGEFRNLDNQICDVEKEAIKAQYEAKIATLQATNEITNKIDASTVDIKNQLFGISTTMASEFCDTKHLIERGNAALSLQIERGFNKITEDDLRDKIDVLRDERECYRRERGSFNDNLLMSQQTNSILNAIDSQLQRQTSQIVQFGAGNLATPVNTNTQTSVN